jgi:hypothetical protein
LASPLAGIILGVAFSCGNHLSTVMVENRISTYDDFVDDGGEMSFGTPIQQVP